MVVAAACDGRSQEGVLAVLVVSCGFLRRDFLVRLYFFNSKMGPMTVAFQNFYVGSKDIMHGRFLALHKW